MGRDHQRGPDITPFFENSGELFGIAVHTWRQYQQALFIEITGTARKCYFVPVLLQQGGQTGKTVESFGGCMRSAIVDIAPDIAGADEVERRDEGQRAEQHQPEHDRGIEGFGVGAAHVDPSRSDCSANSA